MKLVSESEAPLRTRAIFDEVRHALGIPTVPPLYQAYAAFPGFLELHWTNFKPVIETRQFFQMGARLAAECYTRAHNYFDVRQFNLRAQPPANGLSLAQVLDYYQYLDPLLLLIVAVQLQAFEGPVGNERRQAEPAIHPVFPLSPTLPSGAGVAGTVRRIWEDRRRLLDGAFPPEEHRAFALWPNFYLDYWEALRPLVDSPLYADCQYRMGESAWGMACELPGTIETSLPQLFDAGLADDHVSALAKLNESLMHAQSGLLLDVTFARIGYEGGGQTSPNHKEASNSANASSAGSPTRAA